MVLALGIAHTHSAMEAQRAVTDLTNALLKKNAEKLRTASVESAKEAERGIVDVETLTQTNQMLMDTMDEVLTVQKEGPREAAGLPRPSSRASRILSARSCLKSAIREAYKCAFVKID